MKRLRFDRLAITLTPESEERKPRGLAILGLPRHWGQPIHVPIMISAPRT